jgi:beta-glucosidase
VTFTVGTEDVGFYDNKAKFIVETGPIEIYVGNSSDTDQKAEFTVV